LPVCPVLSGSGPTVIHGSFPWYVHEQFADVVTFTGSVPPDAGSGVAFGPTAYEHWHAANGTSNTVGISTRAATDIHFMATSSVV
jgi:hypothetical protein